MREVVLGGAILMASACVGCIAPSVLARAERAVSSSVSEPNWHDALPEDVHGWFESTRIEGDAASSFLSIEYFFAADGTYSGAALAYGGAGPEFQTLSGQWSLAGADFVFDDGATARVLAAPGWLKFETSGGSVVMRRVDEH